MSDGVVSKQAEQSDPAQIRSVILAMGPAPFSVDDAQREISNVRERLNQKPFHTPIQLVQTALAELVGAGEVLEIREGGKPISYQVEPGRIAKRRAAVLQAVANDRDKMVRRRHLLDTVVASPGDLDDLIGAGLLQVGGSDEEALVALPADVELSIVAKGTEALARTTVPDAKGAPSPNAIAAEALAKVEAKLRVSEAKLDRVRVWLRKNGTPEVDEIINGIFEADREPQPADQESFDYEMVVGLTERDWISRQWLRADAEISEHKRKAAHVKLAAETAIKQLTHEVEEYKAALNSSRWTLKRTVRRVPDWASRTIKIVDVLSGDVLKEEPIPRGAQRQLFANDGKPVEALPQAPDPVTVEIVADFVDTMREKGVTVRPARPKRAATELATEVIASPEHDELGPLATPEQKQKRGRKKPSAASSPA